MLNSLTVFLAFLGFLAFGYFSLLRTLYRQLFGAPYKELVSGLNGPNGLRHIGSSAFFVSLPATSLLLFWGWGPALIWLVVFHLLVDSLVNLQVSAQEHQAALSDYLIGLDSSIAALMMRGLLQLYLLLLMAVVLTMLAKLIDKESGLLFGLIGLIPAHALLSNTHQSIPKALKIAGCWCLIALGFFFATQLGFSIYGDWAPLNSLTQFDLPQLAWFRFNNTTVLAGILLCGAFILARKEQFSDDVSKLAGLFIVVIMMVFIIKLIWLRPVLDAPMNASNQENAIAPLPILLTFSLFLFAGLSTLFFRVFNSTAPTEEKLSSAANFGRLQTESLLQLIVGLLLVLCLASALGVGAWKTHFLNWDQNSNFISYLELAIASLLELIYSGTTSANLIHTTVMGGLCIVGLNFLRVCIKALSLADEERSFRIGVPDSFLGLLIQSKLIQAFAAYLLCTYYISNGVSLNTWFLIGIISWIIVGQLMMAMTVNMRKPSSTRTVYGVQSLLVIGLGAMQTLLIAIKWLLGGETGLAALGFGLLATGAYFWFASIMKIISRMTTKEKTDYFDLS